MWRKIIKYRSQAENIKFVGQRGRGLRLCVGVSLTIMMYTQQQYTNPSTIFLIHSINGLAQTNYPSLRPLWSAFCPLSPWSSTVSGDNTKTQHPLSARGGRVGCCVKLLNRCQPQTTPNLPSQQRSAVCGNL